MKHRRRWILAIALLLAPMLGPPPAQAQEPAQGQAQEQEPQWDPETQVTEAECTTAGTCPEFYTSHAGTVTIRATLGSTSSRYVTMGRSLLDDPTINVASNPLDECVAIDIRFTTIRTAQHSRVYVRDSGDNATSAPLNVLHSNSACSDLASQSLSRTPTGSTGEVVTWRFYVDTSAATVKDSNGVGLIFCTRVSTSFCPSSIQANRGIGTGELRFAKIICTGALCAGPNANTVTCTDQRFETTSTTSSSMTARVSMNCSTVISTSLRIDTQELHSNGEYRVAGTTLADCEHISNADGTRDITRGTTFVTFTFVISTVSGTCAMRARLRETDGTFIGASAFAARWALPASTDSISNLRSTGNAVVGATFSELFDYTPTTATPTVSGTGCTISSASGGSGTVQATRSDAGTVTCTVTVGTATDSITVTFSDDGDGDQTGVQPDIDCSTFAGHTAVGPYCVMATITGAQTTTDCSTFAGHTSVGPYCVMATITGRTLTVMCMTGFTAVGGQCVRDQYTGLESTVMCMPGFTAVGGQCVRRQLTGIETTVTCATGLAAAAGYCARMTVTGITATVSCMPGFTVVGGQCVRNQLTGIETTVTCATGLAAAAAYCARTTVTGITATVSCMPGFTAVGGQCVRDQLTGIETTVTCADGLSAAAGYCARDEVAGREFTVTCMPGFTVVGAVCVPQAFAGLDAAGGVRIPVVSDGDLRCPRYSEGASMVCELGAYTAGAAAAITAGCVAAAEVVTLDDGTAALAVAAATDPPRTRCEVRVSATAAGLPARSVVVVFFTTLAAELGAKIAPPTTTTVPATEVHDTSTIWATTAACSPAYFLSITPVTVRVEIGGQERTRIGASVVQNEYCETGGLFLYWHRLSLGGEYLIRGGGQLATGTTTCLDDATPIAQPALSATWRLSIAHVANPDPADGGDCERATLSQQVTALNNRYAGDVIQIEAVVTVAADGTVSVTWRCPATTPPAGTNPVTECSSTRPTLPTGPTRDRIIEGLATAGTVPVGFVYEDGFSTTGHMARLAAEVEGCRVVLVNTVGPRMEYVLRVVSEDPALILCTVIAGPERVDVRVRFTVEWSWRYALSRLARCWSLSGDAEQPDDEVAEDRSLLDRARDFITDLPLISGIVWAVEAIACTFWRFFTPSAAGMSSLVFHSRFAACETVGAPLTGDTYGAEAVRCHEVALLTWWMPLLSETPYDCRGPNVDIGGMLAAAATIQPKDDNGQRVAFFTAAELQPLSGHHVSTCVGTTLGGAVSPLRPVLTPIVLLMALAVMWLSISAIPRIFSADPAKVG